MAGYIGSKSSVTLVDGYSEAEADAEFVTKTGDTMTGNLSLGDNNKAIFGAGSDLEIYSGGTGGKLHANNGVLELEGDSVQIWNAAASEAMAKFTANGSVELYHNNAKKIETTSAGIQVTGNIANASGNLTLDVAGDIILDADGAEVFFADGGTNFLKIQNDSGTAQIRSLVSDGDIQFIGSDGGSVIIALTLDMSDAGTAIFNNNVGIGISSLNTTYGASHSLQIASVSDNNWGGTLVLSSANGTSVLSRLVASTSGFDIINEKNTPTRIFANNTERLRINTNARICINGSATTNGHGNFVGEVGAGSKALMFEHTVGGGETGSITTGSSSTAYNTSSDYRLKENVVDLTGASARVNQLDVKRFNFIADETNTLVDGFLAHEVATVVPEAITGTKDAMKDEEYEVTAAVEEVTDDDGNVTTEAADAVMGTRSVPDMQGIDQSKIVPLLVKTILELEARITALEA